MSTSVPPADSTSPNHADSTPSYLASSHAALASLQADLPRHDHDGDYVSSAACLKCHPNEHASWMRTYHRTMTQPAIPEYVLSDFADTTVLSAGLEYRIFRRGDEFWAELPDPDQMLDKARGAPNIVPEQLPRVQRRVLMTTGSHHYQTYWVGHGSLNSVLNTLPLVYLPQENKWIPREAAFISPPNQPERMLTIWNDHCLNCHSTGGNPGLVGPKQLDTSVSELGISCEACHGPGKNHVAHHSQQPLDAASSTSIHLAHPAQLDSQRSSQICGQCHGIFIRQGQHGMKFATEGIQFRPGQDIHAIRHYVQFPDENSSPQIKRQFKANRQFFRERWWDDGTMLAGGREYSAMLRTACFTKGEMSCLSCHSMHSADPDNQLSPHMQGNQACVQCHNTPQFTTDLASHSHHTADSTGSQCMNCHMPHTSYALFAATRNHTITSPTVQNSVEHGVPNACNLCHLDRTLDWTQQHLHDWYGQDLHTLDDHQQTISAAALWALQGHAAQRVIVAWHFGWGAARQASGGTDWMVPLLAPLLADPYGVVRHVTELSLRDLWPQAKEEYDFLAAKQQLRQQAIALGSTWRRVRQTGRTASWPAARKQATLLAPDGKSDMRLIMELMRGRDDRPVSIKE